MNNEVYVALTMLANKFVQFMFSLIDSNNLPSVIKRATKIDAPETMGNNTQFIDVVINLKDAPMALAFEFGSGIHATRGIARKYVIKPKNVSLLAFKWDKDPDEMKPGKKYVGYSIKTERFLFRYVDHPGVAARPYIIPSAKYAIKESDKLFLKNITAQLLLGGNETIEVNV